MSPVASVEVGRQGAGRVSRTLHAPCKLHIGSSSACDLRVVARGVRARHVALDWDGARLTLIEEPETSGLVRIEGRAIRLPLVITGFVTLQIGDAEVRVVAPPHPDDDPTLVMDRDRTEVPPRPNDEPTAISVRPGLPADATTTQRVRHHRSRLASVCAPVDAACGQCVAITRPVRGWLQSPRVLAASGAILVLVAVALLFCLRRPRSGLFTRAPSVPAAPSVSSAAVAFVGGAMPVASSVPAVAPSGAALLIAGGRRREAAAAYAALWRAHPEEPAFAALARILGRESSAGEESPTIPGEIAP